MDRRARHQAAIEGDAEVLRSTTGSATPVAIDSEQNGWPPRRQPAPSAREPSSAHKRQDHRSHVEDTESDEGTHGAHGGAHTQHDRGRRRTGQVAAVHAELHEIAQHSELAEAVQPLPEAVPVTVAARPPDSNNGTDDAGARRRVRYIAGDVRGSFHPRLYLQSPKCITHNGELITRSNFEKLGKSCMAKWYRSIRVIGDRDALEPLGDWLERHGLPVIRGKERHQRQRMRRRVRIDEDAEAGGEAPLEAEEEDGQLHESHEAEEMHEVDSAGESMQHGPSQACQASSAAGALAAGSCAQSPVIVAAGAAGASHQQAAGQAHALPCARPLEPLPASAVWGGIQPVPCLVTDAASNADRGAHMPSACGQLCDSAFVADAIEEDEWQAGLRKFNDRGEEQGDALSAFVDMLLDEPGTTASALIEVPACDRACHGCPSVDAGGSHPGSSTLWPTASGGEGNSRSSFSPGPPAAPARDGPWQPLCDVPCARLEASPFLSEAHALPTASEPLALTASGSLPPGAYVRTPGSARPRAPPSAFASALSSPYEGASSMLAQSEDVGCNGPYGIAGNAGRLHGARSPSRLSSPTRSSPQSWAPTPPPQWAPPRQPFPDGEADYCMSRGGAYGGEGSAFACGAAPVDAAPAAPASASCGGIAAQQYSNLQAGGGALHRASSAGSYLGEHPHAPAHVPYGPLPMPYRRASYMAMHRMRVYPEASLPYGAAYAQDVPAEGPSGAPGRPPHELMSLPLPLPRQPAHGPVRRAYSYRQLPGPYPQHYVMRVRPPPSAGFSYAAYAGPHYMPCAPQPVNSYAQHPEGVDVVPGQRLPPPLVGS